MLVDPKFVEDFVDWWTAPRGNTTVPAGKYNELVANYNDLLDKAKQVQNFYQQENSRLEVAYNNMVSKCVELEKEVITYKKEILNIGNMYAELSSKSQDIIGIQLTQSEEAIKTIADMEEQLILAENNSAELESLFGFQRFDVGSSSNGKSGPNKGIVESLAPKQVIRTKLNKYKEIVLRELLNGGDIENISLDVKRKANLKLLVMYEVLTKDTNLVDYLNEILNANLKTVDLEYTVLSEALKVDKDIAIPVKSAKSYIAMFDTTIRRIRDLIELYASNCAGGLEYFYELRFKQLRDDVGVEIWKEDSAEFIVDNIPAFFSHPVPGYDTSMIWMAAEQISRAEAEASFESVSQHLLTGNYKFNPHNGLEGQHITIFEIDVFNAKELAKYSDIFLT